jgi:hypothetical protein
LRTLLVSFLAVASLFGAAPAAPADAAPAARKPGTNVVDPAGRPYGHTFGEWSARWWQYMLSVPARRNPLTDPTGRRCGERQAGRMFFLGAEYNHFGTVNRTCRLSTRDAVFFPIVNCKNDNTVPVSQPQNPPTTSTAEQLLAECRAYINSSTELGAQIDGQAIPGLTLNSPNHAAAPSFRVRPPEGNLLQATGYYAPGRQTISPVAADGVYAMLRPLRRGNHKLHFHARHGTDVLDVTYNLQVR